MNSRNYDSIEAAYLERGTPNTLLICCYFSFIAKTKLSRSKALAEKRRTLFTESL